MRKIAIVGPESSGKTTLCEALAAQYNAPFVPEYAREFLTALDRNYEEKDLLVIARRQYEIGMLQEKNAAVLIFHDTDMITMKIWSQEKFGRVDPQIEELVARSQYDHWLLCRPDIPWEDDPLRENPNDRDRLFAIYEAELRSMAKPYSIIDGAHDVRLRKAIAAIEGSSIIRT